MAFNRKKLNQKHKNIGPSWNRKDGPTSSSSTNNPYENRESGNTTDPYESMSNSNDSRDIRQLAKSSAQRHKIMQKGNNDQKRFHKQVAKGNIPKVSPGRYDMTKEQLPDSFYVS
jgi:hypothetical protein